MASDPPQDDHQVAGDQPWLTGSSESPPPWPWPRSPPSSPTGTPTKKRGAARQIAPRRQQDLDDLAVLIDGPVEIGPLAENFRYVPSANHQSPGRGGTGGAAS